MRSYSSQHHAPGSFIDPEASIDLLQELIRVSRSIP